MKLRPLAIALTFAYPATAPLIVRADDIISLEEVIVTAPRMLDPLTLRLDPKAPQQPVPANDGASFLKNVPGFNSIRKGGTDGDPVLRGLAGSRLNVLLDGAEFHGGCGMRMDPPTAYVFPETYDKVTVIKGPQTVRYGNGNSAGVVLFEHDNRPTTPDRSAAVSLLAGAWERTDLLATGSVATDRLFFEATATHAESGDYEDGSGRSVHAAYQRQSASLRAGFRPDRDTRVDIDYTASRAEAAYADRSMDGVKFDRDSYGLTLEKKQLSPLLGKLSARLYHTYIDHVMDNYSLRTKTGGMFMVSNPDRETDGARVAADLDLSEQTVLQVGMDWRDDTHTLRSVSNAAQAVADAYTTLARSRDYASTTTGLFAELTHHLTPSRRVVGGLRQDRWEATRYNAGAYLAGAKHDLGAGFMRYEQDLSGRPATFYVGVGHNARPMDYWEAVNKIGLSATSNLNPEKTTQLDTGVLWKGTSVSGSVSLFYAKVDDYILTRANTYLSSTGVACANANGCAENVDATRYGAEADAAWKLGAALTLRGSLAYVHADNDTMHTPLAQTPPLEGRIGLDYGSGAWTLGGVLRMVAGQDRIHTGYGNIVGQDLATPAGGFATVALNAAYRPDKRTLVSFGIDNLLDKTYAEHISRSGSAVSGYTQTVRVNEPGRFIWAKLNVNFD